jgi:hypothetical protein
MTKFTSQEKAEIKNIVKNCNVMGLTDNPNSRSNQNKNW